MAGSESTELGTIADPVGVALALAGPADPVVCFDGGVGFGSEAWGPWASLRARLLPNAFGPLRLPAAWTSRIARRRAAGGPGGTGIAVVLSYDREPFGHGPTGDLAIEVDAAILGGEGPPRLVVRPDRVAEAERRRLLEAVQRPGPGRDPGDESVPTPSPSSPPRTSLPRARFLRAVDTILGHIRDGDIYQANLTQRFEAVLSEPPDRLWNRLRAASPAPRSAFVRGGGSALVSSSPETFVDVSPDGEARTLPIKGTRRRGADPVADAAAAEDLRRSAKDRAELVMIVDLERNDLGRVSREGTVRVPELAALRSYPAVHHLVATVTSRLRPGVGPDEWVDSVFPGGSVTGAPKQRAMEILERLEPVPRGWYTGALLWFDDDGWTRSSILIRSVVTRDRIARVGAGGGIVFDSDPEAEWIEANDKARALTRALGFEPEEAR